MAGIIGGIKRRAVLFYPMVLAAYPITLWYGENAREAFLEQVVASLAVAVAGTLLVTLLLRLFVKSDVKVAAAVSVLLVFFFTYGLARHLLSVKYQVAIGGFELGEEPYLSSIWLAIGLLVAAAAVLYRGNLAPIVKYGTMLALVLLLFNVGRVVSANWGSPDDVLIDGQPLNSIPLALADPGQAPDIYYIILDSYGRADILQENFGFDNSDFIESLERKGFYVASQSQSNYNQTEFSLSSTLSMRYLDVGEDYGNLVKQNMVAQILKNVGYDYVHISSGYLFTKRNPHANVEYVDNSPVWLLVNDFSFPLMNHTLVKPLAAHIGFDLTQPFERGHADRFIDSMRWIREIPSMPGPTFTFSHNFPPHSPFVFDREGNRTNTKEHEKASRAEGNQFYIDQLFYVNTVVDAVVTDILANSASEPVIIIQGDHGPPNSTGDKDTNPGPYYLRERMAILNAIYLPEHCRTGFYPSISPVNTFRMVLNSCLGGDFELLEDEYYWTIPFSGDPIDFSQPQVN